MARTDINPAKTGIIVFVIVLALGSVVFIGFGVPAGVFAGTGIVNAFTGSPFGWLALFGATLIISSPVISFTIWAIDRVIKDTVDRNSKDKKTTPKDADR